MIGRLNHVGVATPSIERSVALYRDMLGATKIHDKFAMEEQGVWVCFVDLPNSQIELIEFIIIIWESLYGQKLYFRWITFFDFVFWLLMLSERFGTKTRWIASDT